MVPSKRERRLLEDQQPLGGRRRPDRSIQHSTKYRIIGRRLHGTTTCIGQHSSSCLGAKLHRTLSTMGLHSLSCLTQLHLPITSPAARDLGPHLSERLSHLHLGRHKLLTGQDQWWSRKASLCALSLTREGVTLATDVRICVPAASVVKKIIEPVSVAPTARPRKGEEADSQMGLHRLELHGQAMVKGAGLLAAGDVDGHRPGGRRTQCVTVIDVKNRKQR